MRKPDIKEIKRGINTPLQHVGLWENQLKSLIAYIESKELQTYDFDYLNVTNLDDILDNLNVGDTVKCQHCHKEHDKDSQEFFTFYGNVCIGLVGGMIGNNVMDMKVKRITILCRTKKCMNYLTEYIEGGTHGSK